MDLSIREINEQLKTKKVSVKDLVSGYQKKIEEVDGEIGAFLEVFSDIDEQVKTAQELIDTGKAGLLTGIPLAVKDNILFKGRKVSAGSKIIKDYVAPYDSFVAQTLKDQGVVILGRTNMDEFAMGGSTERSAFKVTKNPHDTSRVPGGSSGGSAAAVASGQVVIALGSDTGGSVRQPAAFCGCVGLKPTYGAISRSGLIAMGSSFDQIGPIGRKVSDVEDMFYCLEGLDPQDSTTLSDSERRSARKEGQVKTIGVPRHLIEKGGVDKSVIENFESSLKTLESKGFKIKDIELPSVAYSLSSYYILIPAEVSSNMARFDGMRFGEREAGKDLLGEYMASRSELGSEVRLRSMVGAFVLSSGYYDSYYNKAYTVRRLLSADFERVFGLTGNKDSVDVVATPTTPTPAFKIGEKINDPLSMYMADIFTVSANISGLPAISIPSGFVKEEGSDLPLGLQLTAPRLREDRLFEVAGKFLNEI